MMKKLLIANRGEIARRILKTAKERNYFVGVTATNEDSDSLVCKEADTVVTVSSYLNATEIVEKAVAFQANLIHPGYGFLSENAEFAHKIEKAGITFVGPTPENMKQMGSKESAKKIAQKCSVPTLEALLSDELEKLPSEKWEKELNAKKIFAPFLVKASGGGGGRGMRIVEEIKNLKTNIKRASEEALSAFNDGTVFVERYLKNPKHIEVQVFGNGKGGGVFFGERECSLQRRHQKVIEEAPSLCITNKQREEMGKAALALVSHTKYRGAGTLEFLLDDEGHFYFLEMNTRLQVEHPVTENVYGIDLVHAQFCLAEGFWPDDFPNPNQFQQLIPKAVSIEARILAEDPKQNFIPTPGKILFYQEPQGKGIRVDTGVCENARVNSLYDSLIAKLIVTAPTRAQAIQKLAYALENFIILGCTTNIPFLHSIIQHPDFLLGKHSTNWIEKNLEFLTESKIPKEIFDIFSNKKFREKLEHIINGDKQNSDINSVFFKQGSYLSKQFKESNNTFDDSFSIEATEDKNLFLVSGSAIVKNFSSIVPKLKNIHSTLLKEYAIKLSYNNSCKVPFYAKKISSEFLHISFFGEYFKLQSALYYDSKQNKFATSSGEIRSPMAGKVFEVLVSEGDYVSIGQVLFIIESMKMQLEVRAPDNGKMTNIFVQAGQILSGTDVMGHMTIDVS